MKKRALVGILSGVLACGMVLAGCGKENVSQETVTPAATEETQKPADEKPEVKEEETPVEKEETSAPENNNSDAAGDTEPAEELPQEEVVLKTPTEMYNEICAAVTLNEPMELEDGYIMNLLGIDVSLLEDYVFSISESSISAETVIIVTVKDGGDVDAVAGSIQAYQDCKAAEMENYLPEQYEIVEKGSVTIEGNCIYLVISESQSDIETIIENGLGK